MSPLLSRSVRSGMTLVECALAAAILATITVAGLRAGGAAAVTDAKAAQRATATELATSLLAEITALAYAEPSGSATMGIDTGETAGMKSTYDDVDDYDGHSESPPQDPTGASLTAFAGWTRSVTVARASLADPAVTPGSESGLKRITVNVSRNGVLVRRLVRLLGDAP